MPTCDCEVEKQEIPNLIKHLNTSGYNSFLERHTNKYGES